MTMFWVLAASALPMLIASPARGQVTQLDLQIAARALSFLERPLVGTVRLGIVYIPGDDQSFRSANTVANSLGDGVKAGVLTFKPFIVNIDQAMTAPVDAFFLPNGLGARAAKLVEATEKKKVPCITLDLTQVEAGICALGVRLLPKIQIYVNRAAAGNSDTNFVSVFRMMVTEF